MNRTKDSIAIVCLVLISFAVRASEFKCNSQLYLSKTERDVEKGYKGMQEVSIYALLADKQQFVGKPVSVVGELASLNSRYFLVPMGSPTSRYVRLSRISVQAVDAEECFLKEAVGRVVLVRGIFGETNDDLRLGEVYYMGRLHTKEDKKYLGSE